MENVNDSVTDETVTFDLNTSLESIDDLSSLLEAIEDLSSSSDGAEDSVAVSAIVADAIASSISKNDHLIVLRSLRDAVSSVVAPILLEYIEYINAIDGNNNVVLYPLQDSNDVALATNPAIDSFLLDDVVVNGNFATDSSWVKGAGWSIANGVASCDGTQVSASTLSNGSIANVDGDYEITYTLSNYSSAGGDEGFRVLAGNTNGAFRTANGTYTETLTFTSTGTFQIQARQQTVGDIDNITVREVIQGRLHPDELLTNGDFTTDLTGWELIGSPPTREISSGRLYVVADAGTQGVQQNILTVGKQYQATINYEIVSGTLRFDDLSGGFTKNYSVVGIGSETFTFTAAGANIRAVSTGTGEWYVDNISVKEVITTRDIVVAGDMSDASKWVLGTGWSIAAGVASKSAGTASSLYQTSIVDIGKTYEITFTVSNYSAGTITPLIGNGTLGTGRSANGTYTENLLCSGDTAAYLFASSTFIGDIDNVSVRQLGILASGDYPGDELLTNGDFSSWTGDDPDGWAVTEVGDATSNITQSGNAVNIISDGTDANIRQINALTTGLLYQVTITIDSITGSILVRDTSGGLGAKIYNTTGTHTYEAVATGTDFQIIRNGACNAVISSISIKEANPLNGTIVGAERVSTNETAVELAQNRDFADSNKYFLEAEDSNWLIKPANTLDPRRGVRYDLQDSGDVASSKNSDGHWLSEEKLDTTSGNVMDEGLWAAGSSATLTNPSSDILRIAGNGVNNPNASQLVLSAGRQYTITGEARSDGNAPPRVISGGTTVFTGTTSTDWQVFSVSSTPSSTAFTIRSDTAIATEYTEWRNVSVKEVIPKTRNIVLNGGFDSDTLWTKGVGWSIAAGVASCDGTQVSASNLTTNPVLTLAIGKTWEVEFTVSNHSVGSVYFVVGGIVGTARSADGTYTQQITSTNLSGLIIQANSTFVGDIDNIIVKQVDVSASEEYPSAELLSEAGDGTADADNWSAGNNSTLSNPSTDLLRIARNGTNNPTSVQAILTVGVRVIIEAQVRSDGNATPLIFETSTQWTGTTSTDWQDAEIEFIPSSTSLQLMSLTSTGTEYTEWRNISVKEANPLNGTITGATTQVSTAPPAPAAELLSNNDIASDTFWTEGDGWRVKALNDEDARGLIRYDMQDDGSVLTATNKASERAIGVELLDASNDGVMDADNWIAQASASLTSPSTGILRVARNGSNNPGARSNVTFATGLTYIHTLEARSDGNATPKLYDGGTEIWAGTTSTDWQTVNVTHLKAGAQVQLFSITSTGTEYCEFRSISVKEATSARDIVLNGGFDSASDWTLGTGWTIAAGVASCDGTQVAVTRLTQALAGKSGYTFEITYTVLNYSAGTVSSQAGGSLGTLRNANGTYVDTLTTINADTAVGMRADTDFIGDIDNVSVKQVDISASSDYPSAELLSTAGDGTADADNWTISSSAVASNPSSDILRMTNGDALSSILKQTVLTVGKSVVVTGQTRSDGNATMRLGTDASPSQWTGTTSTSWQDFNVAFTVDNTKFIIQTLGTTIGWYTEWRNISVKEANPLNGDITGASVQNVTGGGLQLLSTANDGVMDEANWTSGSGGVLSNPSADILRITCLVADSAANAYEVITKVGRTYRITAEGRGDGVNGYPFIESEIGTTSTDWQLFSFDYVSTIPNFSLKMGGDVATEDYTEWRNLKVVEQPYTLNVPYSMGFDGATDYADIYSEEFNSMFNPERGTISMLARSNTWAAGLAGCIILYSSAGNQIYIVRSGANIDMTYVANSVIDSVVTSSGSTADWIHLTLTWDTGADELKAYIDGSQVGTTQTGLGSWSGNLSGTQTTIGALSSTPTSVWNGDLAAFAMFDYALSADEIAELARQSGVTGVSGLDYLSYLDTLNVSRGFISAQSASTNMQQPISITAGRRYDVSYTIDNYQSGSVRAAVGNTGVGTTQNADGTYTEEIVAAGDGEFYIETVTDFTGDIENLTVKEQLQTNTINVPYSMDFDGVTDYVDIYSPEFNSMFNPERGTISLLAKVDNSGVWTDGTTDTILRIGTGAFTNELILKKSTTNDTIEGQYRAGGTTKFVSSTLSTTDWFHITLTWDTGADEMKLRIDGSQVGSTQTGLGVWSGNLSSTASTVGAETTTPTNVWHGSIAAVNILPYVLTDTEIAEHYFEAMTRINGDYLNFLDNINYLRSFAYSDGTQTSTSDLIFTPAIPEATTDYDVEFTLKDVRDGGVTPQIGGTNGTIQTTDGSYSEMLLSANTSPFRLVADADFVGEISIASITNTISSVKIKVPWAYHFDGVTDYINISSAEINSMMNFDTGTIAMLARVDNSGVWTDGAARYLTILFADSSNLIRLIKFTTNNTLIFRYLAGGTVDDISHTMSPTDWFHVAMTWDKIGSNQIELFIDGSSVGTSATLGTWVGNLSSTQAVIGAFSTTPTNAWHGEIASVYIRNDVMSDAEILALAQASGVV